MTKDEALKLALEYLEAHKPKISEGSLPVLLHDEIITTIKTQLGVIDEPLASISYIPCCTDQTCPKCKATTPPQRTWVGLTYEEQEEIVLSAHSIRDAINKTDWKLKEKNT